MTDTKRTVSAIALLGFVALAFLGCAPDEPDVAVVSPSLAVRDAQDVLFAYATDTAEENSVARAHAIEALDYTLAGEAGDVYVDALSSDVPAVRFTAAMAIAASEYEPALPALEEAMQDEEDYRVRSGYIYALHRLGDDTNMPELMYLLNLPDWETRANAATIMGMVNHPSAVRGLRNLLADESDQTVQIRIHESLATLGEEQNAMQLEAYTKPGNDTGDQIDAIRALARLRTDRARVELERVLYADNVPLVVRVAAAGGLGRMRVYNEYGYDLCLEAISTPHQMLQEEAPDERIDAAQIRALQQMGAVSLGWIGEPRAIDHLYPLLRRPDPDVQVAAAMSILQLAPNRGRLDDEPVMDDAVMAPAPAPTDEAASEDEVLDAEAIIECDVEEACQCPDACEESAACEASEAGCDDTCDEDLLLDDAGQAGEVGGVEFITPED
jgi:HEAT repeat protein